MSKFDSNDQDTNYIGLNSISSYYDEKIESFGSTPNGVDWKDQGSQYIRLQKVTEILPIDETFSINDLGCGYGELVTFLKDTGYNFRYIGYDVSKKMINEAENNFSSVENVSFINSSRIDVESDFSVASGIFSVKTEIEDSIWQTHVYDTLNMMYEKSTKGFSFNILSSYSDVFKQKKHLYYGSPDEYLRYCLKNFSWKVQLDHSYDLYEFTISVYKGKK
jgi:SAM-dependent methyltransferase